MVDERWSLACGLAGQDTTEAPANQLDRLLRGCKLLESRDNSGRQLPDVAAIDSERPTFRAVANAPQEGAEGKGRTEPSKSSFKGFG